LLSVLFDTSLKSFIVSLFHPFDNDNQEAVTRAPSSTPDEQLPNLPKRLPDCLPQQRLPQHLWPARPVQSTRWIGAVCPRLVELQLAPGGPHHRGDTLDHGDVGLLRSAEKEVRFFFVSIASGNASPPFARAFVDVVGLPAMRVPWGLKAEVTLYTGRDRHRAKTQRPRWCLANFRELRILLNAVAARQNAQRRQGNQIDGTLQSKPSIIEKSRIETQVWNREGESAIRD